MTRRAPESHVAAAAATVVAAEEGMPQVVEAVVMEMEAAELAEEAVGGVAAMALAGAVDVGKVAGVAVD